MPLPRIELARGRWLRFERPMYISERRQLADIARDTTPDAPLLDIMDRYLSVLGPVVAERSWDGDLDRMTPDEMFHVVTLWRDQTEDAALPPD